MSETIHIVTHFKENQDGYTELIEAAFTDKERALEDLEDDINDGRVISTQLYRGDGDD